MRNKSFKTHSSDETKALGREIGQKLAAGAVLTLSGELGAGKTTFIHGIVEGVGQSSSRLVSSPTFSLLNIYPAQIPIYHFDLYRLPRLEEFLACGFDEYLDAGGICCIEWAEKVQPLLPPETIAITLHYLSEEGREICVQ